MALTGDDFALARAARWLAGRGHTDLATRLLSCDMSFESNDLSACDVSLKCPRDMYELLWDVSHLTASDYDYNWYLRVRGIEYPQEHAPKDAWSLYEAFRETLLRGAQPSVAIIPQYGKPNRSARTQTELYLYVFGDDPIGQQIQMLDTGPSSSQRRQLIVSPSPVLPVEDVRRDQNLCFVIMPFASEFRVVYDQGIQPAVQEAKLECQRGDDIMQAGQILAQVWTSLLRARLVIADVSHANGNVLYELGMSHVLGHQVILLTQNITDVPFDLRQQRHIVYSMDSDGLTTLRAKLGVAIESTLASL